MQTTSLKSRGTVSAEARDNKKTPHSIPLDYDNEYETIILAAMWMSDYAMELFRKLGGTRILSNPDIRTVATALMMTSDPGAYPHVVAALSRAENGRTLADALDTRTAMLLDSKGVLRHEWAVADMVQCLAALAGRWLGPQLQHAVRRLERGEPAAAVAGELLVFIDLAMDRRAA